MERYSLGVGLRAGFMRSLRSPLLFIPACRTLPNGDRRSAGPLTLATLSVSPGSSDSTKESARNTIPEPSRISQNQLPAKKYADFSHPESGCETPVCRAELSGNRRPRIPELASMADVLNPEQTESTPLNTELETPTLDATTEQLEPSHESTYSPETASVETETVSEPSSLSTQDQPESSAPETAALARLQRPKPLLQWPLRPPQRPRPQRLTTILR